MAVFLRAAAAGIALNPALTTFFFAVDQHVAARTAAKRSAGCRQDCRRNRRAALRKPSLEAHATFGRIKVDRAGAASPTGQDPTKRTILRIS
jgi:hypothetical protein